MDADVFQKQVQLQQQLQQESYERRALILHERAWAKKWTPFHRHQFIALVNLVGSIKEATRLAKHIIVWKMDFPDEATLIEWAEEASSGDPCPPEIERAIERRLHGFEEWSTRAVIHAFREEAVRTVKEDRGKDVRLKYLADGIAMMTQAANSHTKERNGQPLQVGNLVINAGPPPKPKLKPGGVPQIDRAPIEGEFKELA